MHLRLVCRTLGVALLTASTALAVQVPTIPAPFQIELQGKLEFLYVGRVDSDSPRQHPQGKLRLHMTADLSPKLAFIADLTGTAGGTPRDPDGPGVYDLGHVLQDRSPSLELGEVYLEARSQHVDVRLGIQKFAWGKLDALQPNDLLNPFKFHDAFMEDEIDRKIGVPAIAPTFYLPKWTNLPSEMRLTLVWAPIYVPFFFPDQDERWYPPLARVPEETQAMGFTATNSGRVRNAPVPARSLDNGSWAARFSGLIGGADFALYYFEGFDPAPTFDADATGFVRLNVLNPQLFDVRSEVEIFPSFHRIRSFGADLAYRAFDATLRIEGAYVFDRAYPRSINEIVARQQFGEIDIVGLVLGQERGVDVTLNEVNVERDGVEWGAGGDTFIGDTFVLVQANQTAVLRNDADLLISDLETRFALTVRHGFIEDRLKAELIGVYGMQGVYGVAHPRLTYSINDHFDVRIGYVMIEGRSGSYIGQYKHNDQAYVRARFLF